MKPISLVAALPLLLLPTWALAQQPQAKVKTEPVEYRHGDTTLQGFLVYDEAAQGKRPGVVVFPEWWGITDYPKSRAEQLARLGYVAFVADMYGKGVTTDKADEAGKRAGPFYKDPKLTRDRAALALEQLNKSDRVAKDQVAAIGFCFGGSCALELARSGADIKGVVSFHGGLETAKPAQTGDVKAQLLVLTGAADPMVPADQLIAFAEEMTTANADWQLVVYSNAKHAFTNPNADKYNLPPVAYDESADKRSWAAMQLFFNEIFDKAK